VRHQVAELLQRAPDFRIVAAQDEAGNSAHGR
jgi:hypothetical protein